MKLLILGILLALLLSEGVQAQTATVTWTNTHQTIDGFGGSVVGDYIALPTNLADFFFSPSSGIGLSILRVQVIPDSSTCVTYCSTRGCKCVASTGATILTGELLSIQQAQARGVTTFFASSWSPPASMKSNASWLSGGTFLGGSSNYSSLASVFTSYVSLLQANGVTLYGLSPQNEPNVNTGYQSALWTAQQFHDFIPVLNASLSEAGFGSTKIIFPEYGQWSNTYGGFAATAMNDAAVSPLVGIMAGHGYAGDKNIVAPTTYGKHVWMTEDSDPSPTYDGTMTDAMVWAVRIHNYLAVANVNAYVWWTLSDMPSLGEGTDNSALTDFNGNIAKRAYVTGNWSKFVRPGWVRIDANATPQAGVYVTAFKEVATGNFAIVAVNDNGNNAEQSIALSGFNSSSVTPWVTSAGLSLAQQTGVSVVNNAFSYSLPADSVTTFVGVAGSGVASRPNPPSGLVAVAH
jgi:glucuronoarabinoxylan endo-1,4-beta-xylanase